MKRKGDPTISPTKPRAAAWTLASRPKGIERRDMPFPAIPTMPPSKTEPTEGVGREGAERAIDAMRLGTFTAFFGTFVEAFVKAFVGAATFFPNVGISNFVASNGVKEEAIGRTRRVTDRIIKFMKTW